MPFQPGNSGHPEGQRRAKLFTEALRMEIAAAGDNHQALRRVARALLAEAYKGNIAAIGMIFDRIDGKVPQPVGGALPSWDRSGCTSAGALTSSPKRRWRLQQQMKGRSAPLRQLD